MFVVTGIAVAAAAHEDCDHLFLPTDFHRTSPQNHTYDTDTCNRTKLVWQYNVYNTAGMLASERDGDNPASGWIIDIGCGNGEKGAALYEHGSNWLGIDHGVNFEAAKQTAAASPRYRASGGEGVAFAEWNIDNAHGDGPDLPAAMPIRGAIVLCSDVIEHLFRPLNVLRFASALLEKGARAFVLSTPDRSALVAQKPRVYTHKRTAWPKDVQFWAPSELHKLLARVLGCSAIDARLPHSRELCHR